MPRVKQVTAAKDYPQYGIVKGQKHYHWKRKTGPRTSVEYRQVEPPRIEQLTGSAYKIAMHYIEEARSKITSYEELDDLKQMVEDLASEQREKFDNMPEGLQQGDTGQTLEQQADTLDEAASEIDSLKDDWEQAYGEWEDDKSEYDEAIAAHEAAMVDYDNAKEAYENWDEESGEPQPGEPEEPEEPEEVDEEFDSSEYLDRLHHIALES